MYKNILLYAFLDKEWFTVLVSSITASLGYILKSLWDSRVKKERLSKEEKQIDGMKAYASTYNSMEQIKQLQEVGRVFMLEVGNGGDVAKPGSTIYARGVDIFIDRKKIAKPDKGKDWNLRKFEAIKVDGDYVRMVINAKMTQGPYKFDVKKKSDCLLKRIYLEQGIKYALIYHIYSDVNSWKEYIISVSVYDNSDISILEEEENMALIENNIHTIRNNFKKYR